MFHGCLPSCVVPYECNVARDWALTFFWGCEGRSMEILGVMLGKLLGHPYLGGLNLVGVATIKYQGSGLEEVVVGSFAGVVRLLSGYWYLFPISVGDV